MSNRQQWRRRISNAGRPCANAFAKRRGLHEADCGAHLDSSGLAMGEKGIGGSRNMLASLLRCSRISVHAHVCPPNRTEQILRRRLEALGGNVARPSEFIRSDWDGTHVNAEISANGVSSTVRARWLVGCDRMHGVVR